MALILSEFSHFFGVREETLTTLKKIKSEIDEVAMDASDKSIILRAVSLGALITGGACLVAAPFTAGATAPVVAGMAALSGGSKLVSVGVMLVKHFEESGLLKTASKVIKKDQRAQERLQAAAKTIRLAVSNAKTASECLEAAAKIGLITTKEVNAALNLPATARAAAIAGKAVDVVDKVNKVAKIVSPVLVFVSIPLDILGIIADLLERGEVSEASKEIQKNIEKLENEYKTVKSEYDQIKSVI
jgi:hypothetical protein